MAADSVSVVRVAPECGEPLELYRRAVAGAGFRGLRYRLEHLSDSRAVSRLRASMAVDVLFALWGLVAPRGLV